MDTKGNFIVGHKPDEEGARDDMIDATAFALDAAMSNQKVNKTLGHKFGERKRPLSKIFEGY